MVSNVLLVLMGIGGLSLTPHERTPQNGPTYARPVQTDLSPVPFPDDPVISSKYRPAEVPYEKATIERATRRILEITRITRLREAKQFQTLTVIGSTQNRIVPREPLSGREREYLKSLESAISDHWEYFATRVAEVRFFQHRPNEAQLAAERAQNAWQALKGLIEVHPKALPDDLANEIEELELWVKSLEEVASS